MGNKRHVFLCHASEDKEVVVAPIAKALKNADISYWLDKAEIKWGDSIIDKVNDGLKVSEYVMVFLSEFFITKPWPQRELYSALNIEASTGKPLVLPLIVGNSRIRQKILENYPLLNDKAYMVWEDNPEPIVNAMKARLENPGIKTSRAIPIPIAGQKSEIPLPKIKRKFTQRDKDIFLKEAFVAIKSYFKNGLRQLQAKYQEVEIDFTEIHNFKFISTVYVDGEVKAKCKIWIGGIASTDTISYSEGSSSIDNDSSCNDWMSIREEEGQMFFEASGMSFFNHSKNEKLDSGLKAAEYFWGRLLKNME